ncbi:Wall-associated receptor kinase-like 2 [Morella rubra]|uniref:Wall-associated receptor kinase-like 2 n=1 Tax=Morella rubra TaxID=262757 RepID=A0A6A1WD04_9ROSI|nr:Wall-associated receptor kinase-like 2 [Morella rubra]
MAVQMVFPIIFLLSTLEPFAQATKLAKGSCQDRCGNVSIPYPFGMGAPHCYLDEWFAIDCDVTEPTGSRKSFLRNYGIEVLKIQLDSSTGLVKVIMGGSMSVCDETESVNASDCNGINCCQTAIPSGLGKFFNLTVKPINDGKVEESVRSAFLVDTEWFKENFRMPIPDDYTVALAIQWQINSSLFNSLGLSGNAEGSSTSPTYHCSNQTAFGNNRSLAFICSCKRGYEGNPYLPEGCQMLTNVQILISTLVRVFINYSAHFPCNQKRNTSSIIVTWMGIVQSTKEKEDDEAQGEVLQTNGGLLLQQQLSSSEVNVGNPNLFTSKDLEKATDHFNVNRILGQGGQGTVYKAMLPDGKIIAVKKSKVIGQEKIKEFINEVVILSRINHRNVVKLLGCCLETEVPLLVYEFIQMELFSNTSITQHGFFINMGYALTNCHRSCRSSILSTLSSFLTCLPPGYQVYKHPLR